MTPLADVLVAIQRERARLVYEEDIDGLRALKRVLRAEAERCCDDQSRIILGEL